METAILRAGATTVEQYEAAMRGIAAELAEFEEPTRTYCPNG